MLSDPDLLDLYEAVNSRKGRADRDQIRCGQVAKHLDGSRIPGFGSFRGLLDWLLEGEQPWSREEIAIPAALAVFAPPACWTEGRLDEVKSGIASVAAFIGQYEPLIARAEGAVARIPRALNALIEGNLERAEECLGNARAFIAPLDSMAGTCSRLDKALALLRRGDQDRAINLLKTVKIPLADRCDRAWEYAMAWLLGASGAPRQWESEGWESPMDAWGTLIRIVSDSVEATCNYLGGTIGGAAYNFPADSQNLAAKDWGEHPGIATNPQNSQPYRRGMKVSEWAERGARVPFFKSFLESEPPGGDVPPKEKKSRKAEWTYQLCEALTGKNGAECLCTALHRLYLKNPAEARRLAAVEAKEAGIRAVQRFAASNIKEKIRTHGTWHHITAWDGVQPLFQFLMRAVRGGFQQIQPKQMISSMLGHLLRQDLYLHEVNVAIKHCQKCKDEKLKKNENFVGVGKIDVFSTDLVRCDQCGKKFDDTVQTVSKQMFILLGEDGGFEPRDVRKCSNEGCQAIFFETDSVSIKSVRRCPFCKSKAGQRAFEVYFLKSEPSTTFESVELTEEEKREVRVIYHLVLLKVDGKNHSQQEPPNLTPAEMKLIPDLPKTDTEIKALWQKWSGRLDELFEIVKQVRDKDSVIQGLLE